MITLTTSIGPNTPCVDVAGATTANTVEFVDAGIRDIEILNCVLIIAGVERLADERLDAETRAQMVVTLPARSRSAERSAPSTRTVSGDDASDASSATIELDPSGFSNDT